MKFKIEVSLLLLAITLFAVSMFFYSIQSGIGDSASMSLAYPYRGIALAFVGFGSVSMVTASISYSKKSKNIIQ